MDAHRIFKYSVVSVSIKQQKREGFLVQPCREEYLF